MNDEYESYNDILKKRNLETVMDQILALVPNSEVDIKQSLSGDFANIKTSIPFTAPEFALKLWERAADSLMDVLSFGIDDENIPEWKIQIAELWTTKPRQEIFATMNGQI